MKVEAMLSLALNAKGSKAEDIIAALDWAAAQANLGNLPGPKAKNPAPREPRSVTRLELLRHPVAIVTPGSVRRFRTASYESLADLAASLEHRLTVAKGANLVTLKRFIKYLAGALVPIISRDTFAGSLGQHQLLNLTFKELWALGLLQPEVSSPGLYQNPYQHGCGFLALGDHGGAFDSIAATLNSDGIEEIISMLIDAADTISAVDWEDFPAKDRKHIEAIAGRTLNRKQDGLHWWLWETSETARLLPAGANSASLVVAAVSLLGAYQRAKMVKAYCEAMEARPI